MTLIDSLRERRAARRLAREAAAFPQGERAGLGLSRGDFTAIATMTAARVARMETMAAMHGVTDAMLDACPETRLDVALTCARCGHVGDCTRELTSPAGTCVERCGFCPNGDTFAALARGA